MEVVIEGIPNKLDGILLDFDGTLIDLIPKWWKPLENAFLSVKGEVPEDRLRKNISNIMHDMPVKASKIFLLKIIWSIGREGGLSILETIKFVKYARVNFQKSKYINVLLPGVEDYLLDWKANNVKMCIVTTAGREEMDRAILDLAILDGIPIVTREDVINLKPHPEPLYKALEILGLDSKNTVFVGDFVSDIEAGKKAGSFTIGLLGQLPEISRPNLEKAEPDLLVQYLKDIKYTYANH